MASFLSQVCTIPLPNDLNDSAEEVEEEDNAIEVVKQAASSDEDLYGVWEDVKEKNFYTVIPLLGELMEAHPEICESKSTQSNKDGEKIQSFWIGWKMLEGTI